MLAWIVHLPGWEAVMKHLLAPAMALVLLSPFIAGCKDSESAPSGQTQQDAPPPAVSQGQSLFLTNCVSCHQGLGNPPGPNEVIMDSEKLNTEAAFRNLLRHPASAMMRAFSEQELSNADVHEIYVYLHALRTPPAHR
jgi:mono/diheme cytochrome c family protein